ncbi:hypothetical protein A2U01_0097808, partial [Trifolium medium]|nr:hypothetical protein [Trifolium medium]
SPFFFSSPPSTDISVPAKSPASRPSLPPFLFNAAALPLRCHQLAVVCPPRR